VLILLFNAISLKRLKKSLNKQKIRDYRAQCISISYILVSAFRFHPCILTIRFQEVFTSNFSYDFLLHPPEPRAQNFHLTTVAIIFDVYCYEVPRMRSCEFQLFYTLSCIRITYKIREIRVHQSAIDSLLRLICGIWISDNTRTEFTGLFNFLNIIIGIYN
jgi:hypothetical protein